MSTAGPNMCGTGSDYNDGSGTAWSNPAYIQADDGNYATCAIIKQNFSHMLKAQNFGFSIPLDATVINVSFSYQRKAYAANNIKEKTVTMLDASGSAGTDVADTSTTWTLSDVIITKSGDGSYWGITLSSSLVNDADFGLQIKLQNVGTADTTALIDYVSCTVTYSLGGLPQSECRGAFIGSFRGAV